MKALNFLKSLLPNFAKSTVLDDCRLTKLMLVTITQPSYDSAMRLFNNRKFESPTLKQNWDVYRRNVKGAQGANTIVAIEKSLKNMVSTLDLIEALVEKDYNEDIAGGGISYYKSAVLQLLENIGFAAEYATKYLNYVLVIETSLIDSDDHGLAMSDIDEISTSITPAEMRFISERFMDFVNVMAILTRPTPSIQTDLESIPDVAVTEATDKVMQATVGAKLDPFNHGIIPLWANPIYHVRMHIAEYQVAKLNAAKTEKEVLELRLLAMKRRQEGKNDPALEKQIEYNMKRLDELRISIRQREEEYAR